MAVTLAAIAVGALLTHREVAAHSLPDHGHHHAEDYHRYDFCSSKSDQDTHWHRSDERTTKHSGHTHCHDRQSTSAPQPAPRQRAATGSAASASASSAASPRQRAATPPPTPTPLPTTVELGGQTLHLDSYIRDQHLGQTYRLVRHPQLGIARRWIAPTDPAIYVIDWADLLAHKTFPTNKVAAISLDERNPPAGMLVRDSASGRIVHYDPHFQQWRHVPDIPTFQVLELRWCDLNAAAAGFLERITEGVAHPATSQPEQADYPLCG